MYNNACQVELVHWSGAKHRRSLEIAKVNGLPASHRCRFHSRYKMSKLGFKCFKYTSRKVYKELFFSSNIL